MRTDIKCGMLAMLASLRLTSLTSVHYYLKSRWGGASIGEDNMDVQQLMGIHRKAISCASGDESSLSDSVRDEGTLDFIVMRAESHDTPEERASEYLWCIANWHPFVEGNKRTAWLAAQASLGGKVMVYPDATECDAAVRRMAAGMCESEQALEFVGCRLEPCEGDPVDYAIRTQIELLRKLSERRRRSDAL